MADPTTDSTDAAKTSTTEAARARTSASLKLPKTTFERVREIVDGSQQMNGPASPAVIADLIGKTAKGQNWSDPWSTVQSLGFIEKKQAGKYDITDLGRRFLSEDEEDARRAAQEALMRTGFGPLIKRFRTGASNTKAMTGVLISDYGVHQAGKAAELLVTMATECGLIVDGRMKPAEIERAEEAAGEEAAVPPDPSATPKPSPAKAAPKPAATPAAANGRGSTAPQPAAPATAPEPAAVTPAPPTPSPAPNGGGAVAVPFGLGPTVVLNVDARKLSAAEIGEIVRELRKAAGSS